MRKWFQFSESLDILVVFYIDYWVSIIKTYSDGRFWAYQFTDKVHSVDVNDLYNKLLNVAKKKG